ncbi:MAG: SIR2 family protein [Ignavibacteriaceae bacterium]|jgi:hypothetical protein
MVLTKEIVYKAIRDFFTSNPSPLVIFGTGMSCAIDVDFGMNKLNSQLQSEMPKKINGQKELEKEWNKVVGSLKGGIDLESSLDHVHNSALISLVVEITGNLIAQLDKKYSYQILNGTKVWPATDFFMRLVDGLPESDRKLHVITPNYDMLAEYAFENVGIKYINGFSGCLIRKVDWSQARNSVSYLEKIIRNNKLQNKANEFKHIELHKVHGSLNTFFHKDEVIEVNSWIHKPPNNIERVIITPGVSKYEKISCFRKELLEKFDKAIEIKDSFIFLGYGFNDKHIENYVIQKLINQKCHGIIITRDCNKKIEAILEKAANLWLVCKQESNNFTRIKNKNYEDWLFLNSKSLWNIEEFTKEILEVNL